MLPLLQNNLRMWKKKTKVPTVQLIDETPTADTNNTPEYLLSEAGELGDGGPAVILPGDFGHLCQHTGSN